MGSEENGKTSSPYKQTAPTTPTRKISSQKTFFLERVGKNRSTKL